jgi:hypothetical protein
MDYDFALNQLPAASCAALVREIFNNRCAASDGKFDL